MVVDVQNDFISGTLPVKNAVEVVPVINELIRNADFNVVTYTLDCHPHNHCSFIENISMRKLSPKSPVNNFFFQEPKHLRANLFT